MNHIAGNSQPLGLPQSAGGPQVRHVNLMVDTIITNVASDDIRTLVRALLSSSPAHVTDQFCSLAKAHLNHIPIPPPPRGPELFAIPPSSDEEELKPTPAFETLLARARARYGAGLGVSSIQVLLPIVEVAATMPWTEESAIEESLAIVDSDIAAALLNTKEETGAGGEAGARAIGVLRKLRDTFEIVKEKVEARGGDFPFERSEDALSSLELD
ncbi:hypothetical protein M408DRAFT_14629 [Serendipita vermifera MAFF 305830]|uniref:Uncharacterized protein n=1 Tax=Serendipita vermifera MAFF 305830 TaxID=933852 RepID=A0A0C3B5K6_SERVB|nr:hypothetical protein M408DRAFT_14629 [Serendipita vermifera MAFF 305830]